MRGYFKLWTDFEYDPWVQSLSCLERGFFVQLCCFSRSSRDVGNFQENSPFIYKSMASLGQRCGCDGKTSWRILAKFRDAGRIKLYNDEHGNTWLEVINFDKWQGFKSVSDVDESRKTQGKLKEKSTLGLYENNPKSKSKSKDIREDLNPPIAPLPEIEIVPIEQTILDDLNQVTGRKYRLGESTKKLLNARLSEGYSLADFQRVHRIKAKQWLTDPKMALYLRPETLYNATKFQSYVNEPEFPFGMSQREINNKLILQKFMDEPESENGSDNPSPTEVPITEDPQRLEFDV